MKLVTRIFNRIKKRKEKSIEQLALELIEKMKPYYDKALGVNHIYIYYDFDHHKKSNIHLNCNHGKFQTRIETEKPNKNFKL